MILLSTGYVATNTVAAVDPAKEQQIEGLTAMSEKGFYGGCSEFLAGPYGRNCDDSDSGTMTYVSMRYGGFNLSANNEINGLTLGGVGRETDLDYIEVFNNKDDGVEFFGGAAQVKHLISRQRRRRRPRLRRRLPREGAVRLRAPGDPRRRQVGQGVRAGRRDGRRCLAAVCDPDDVQHDGRGSGPEGDLHRPSEEHGDALPRQRRAGATSTRRISTSAAPRR